MSDPDLALVTRRAFIPIYRLDRISGLIFWDKLPYCEGDLERWAEDGGKVVEEDA